MRFLSTVAASLFGTLIAIGLLLIVSFLFLAALVASSNVEPSVQPGSVLVMDLSGPIPEIVSSDPLLIAFGGESAIDSYDIKHALKKAAVDKRINGVWLRMRGVAANWATLHEIREALLTYKESGKFLVASSGEYGMSERDFFLASTADSVFASPEAFFEFNGLYLEVMYYKGLLDKLEAEAEVIRAGDYKAAVEPFLRRDMSVENETQLNALLSAHNSSFMEAVADGRSLEVSDIEAVATDGALLTAAEAREVGLLDRLVFEDEVISSLKDLAGVDEDDPLRRITVRSYAATPDSKAGLSTGNQGTVAVVYAVGTIVSGKSGTGRGIIGSKTFNEAMREARRSSRIKAVVLRINSPGGSATASDAMWREIKLTAEEKPVIVSMGDLAASGGYWIATAADTIIADPQTLTGSIGVFGLVFNVGQTLESKLGLTTDGVRTSPYADMFSGMRSLSAAERALLERAVASTYGEFLQKVADSRGMDVDAVDRIGQGRIWTGEQARELGLVDIMGTLDAAIRIAAETADLSEGTYRITRLPRPKTLIEGLNDAFLVRVSDMLPQPLNRQTAFLEEMIRNQGTVQARMQLDVTVR